MDSSSSFFVRPARSGDFAALTAIEKETFGKQGVNPYGPTYFAAWQATNNDGFLVALKDGIIGGYAYMQRVAFDPWHRPAAIIYDDFTDHGYTVKTHDQNGQSCQCVSGAATAPGAGKALLKGCIQECCRLGVSHYFSFTRLAGFSKWMEANGLLTATEGDPSVFEYEVALWYALENGRITKSLVWPEAKDRVFPVLPKVRKLDPSLAPQLMVEGVGLLDVLPNCMEDPMSRNFAALLVRKLIP